MSPFSASYKLAVIDSCGNVMTERLGERMAESGQTACEQGQTHVFLTDTLTLWQLCQASYVMHETDCSFLGFGDSSG